MIKQRAILCKECDWRYNPFLWVRNSVFDANELKAVTEHTKETGHSRFKIAGTNLSLSVG